MLFGFVVAIVVGFLLTAVQTWTQEPGIKGLRLISLVLLWLLARLAFFSTPWLPSWVIATLDLLFLPCAAVTLAIPVVRVRQWRNIVFVPILLAMTAANVAMHLAVLLDKPEMQVMAGNAMVMVVTFLMTVMAGRVVPMFTANGTHTEKVQTLGWLEGASVATILLAVLVSFELPGVSPEVAAFFFILAALTHALRVLRWRIWVTFRTPLVWSLHLSYWCIPLGLLLYGLSEVNAGITQSQATHTLTVGAMGMMILAMISRVSLGHTGRSIVVGKVMTAAFLALYGAFFVRVFGVYWFENYANLIAVAAALWVLAYGCFCVLYFPILTRPRPDGQPG
jgi:uncharacterized protein involved in response to NO